jgi:carboxymethylenebutenolidase
MNKGVRSAACFYATDLHKGSLGLGMNDNSIARMPELAAAGTEMCMIWGIQDPHVPLDGRVRVHAAMAEARVRFTWHEFNGQHAFMRDEGPRYDGELALHCYRMCVDLFSRTLHAGHLPVPAAASTGGGETSH